MRKARATSSVVVPILMNSEEPLEISAAACSPMRALFVIGQMPARLIGDVLDTGCQDRAAMGARQQALAAEVIEILADGLRRHIELGGQFLDIDPAVEAGQCQGYRSGGASA